MIIATRTLTVVTKSGQEADVAIRLFLPEGKEDRWECRYEIDFPEDGWPAQTVKSHAIGSDALHALQLAMHKLGVELHMTTYHAQGTMRWGYWDGYGLALPKDARDLMRGDDLKYWIVKEALASRETYNRPLVQFNRMLAACQCAYSARHCEKPNPNHDSASLRRVLEPT